MSVDLNRYNIDNLSCLNKEVGSSHLILFIAYSFYIANFIEIHICYRN